MDRTVSRIAGARGFGCRHLMVLVAVLFLCACDKPTPDTFQGYVEGEFVYVASPLGGRLETLQVRRGNTVKKGARLFVLEHALEEAMVREASQKYRQATDRLANLKKGKRPSEIQAITANSKALRRALNWRNWNTTAGSSSARNSSFHRNPWTEPAPSTVRCNGRFSPFQRI
jgi:multidrug resistance efflux pump